MKKKEPRNLFNNENYNEKWKYKWWIPSLRLRLTVISLKVRWLLKHGAKVKSDKYGKTPLSDAAENKQHEVEMHCMLIIVFTF